MEQQTLLFAENDFKYVRNGPGAGGWPAASDTYYRCRDCEYMMSAYPSEPDECFCGNLYKDVGRLGSVHGDGAIGIYQASPKAPS